MSQEVKILVCCHKPDIHAAQPPYFPIQVGASVNNVDLGFQKDNSGVNISLKNRSYCELTGIYWAWKNLQNVSVIGLCHYRRYFDFHKQCSSILPHTEFESSKFEGTDLSIPTSILEKVREGYVVVPKANNCPVSLYDDYCIGHISDDIRIVEDVLKSTQPEDILKAYFKVMKQGNKFYPYNMFIMNWQVFDAYCNWLFGIMNILEERIDISSYNSYQKRIFGFLSERLFNVWIEAKEYKTIEKPVIWFVDQPQKISLGQIVKYLVRSVNNHVSTSLTKPKLYENWRQLEIPKYLK